MTDSSSKKRKWFGDGIGTIAIHWPGLRHKWLWAIGLLVIIVIGSSAYLLATSPFSSDSIIHPPFTTRYEDGHVTLQTHYQPRFYSGWLASTIGYYRGAVAVVWDRLTSPKVPADSVQSIADNIYSLRFDPSQPYLISGDQFDALYPRNLSVFYQDLLDPQTAVSTTDWHNRQRIAVQSLAYVLSSMEQLNHPVTTLMPISSHGVLAINIYDYPSDTMFSVFELLSKLEANPATKQVALMLQQRYAAGLVSSYQNYLTTVRNPATGFVRSTIHLSSARDSTQRQSSFYDNVILWKTEQLATSLGFDHVSDSSLSSLRNRIIQRYWDGPQGHFIDDLAPEDSHSYSSDWLITLPLGFLEPSNSTDLAKLVRISAYIDKERLAVPLPIRYTTTEKTHENAFVRLFAGAYGDTAIWSYWGDLYMTLETDLYQQTGQAIYARHAERALAGYQAVIVRDHGYPETLNASGKMYETPFYESIRRNGWIVDFEAVRYNWDHLGPVKVRQPS